MVLRLNQEADIENLRAYPAETVEQVRQLLAAGAPARPDPRRKDFYELENGCRVYYIHISPINGKVLLLASWLKDARPAEVSTSPQAA